MSAVNICNAMIVRNCIRKTRKIPGHQTGDEVFVWFSSERTNMGQQASINMLFLGLLTHAGHLFHRFFTGIIARKRAFVDRKQRIFGEILVFPPLKKLFAPKRIALLIGLRRAVAAARRCYLGSSQESDMASLRVHTASLRKKDGKGPRHPIIGIGYRMMKNELGKNIGVLPVSCKVYTHFT